METSVMLQFEHKNDVTIIVKFLFRAASCEPRASSAVKFDNDCDVIPMFKCNKT